jgi:uncharacterized protein DUF4440
MRRFIKPRLVTLLFLGFVLITSSAEQAVTGLADREKILGIERIFADTVVSNDVQELQNILADDYIGTETDGRLVTKADSIAEAKSEPSEFASCHLNENDVRIRFYGEVAVVNGTETWRRKDGKPGRFIWTDVMVKRHDKWQVVSSQDLAVSSAK